jgi:ribonuclease Z
LATEIDYGGHSVVISGDTRYSENLIKFAKGADVIIHEVALADKESTQNSTCREANIRTSYFSRRCRKSF